MSRHIVLPWIWDKQILPKILLPIYEIIQQYFPENTNPGWLTQLILCTCKVHSLRLAGVCVCLFVVSVRSYCSLRQSPMRREGEPLTMSKYYSTLVWMITHAYFTAFSRYDSCTECTTHVIRPTSLMKQQIVVTHQYRVLQGTEKAWHTNLSVLYNSNVI
jgi:hypothetical protein